MTTQADTAGWLIDKSALVRLATSSSVEVWADRIERGLVRIATVTLLQVGYSARDAQNLRAGKDFEFIAEITGQDAERVSR